MLESEQMLDELRTKLLVMCGMVRQAVENSFAAMRSGDHALAETVIDNDGQIDTLENEIDAMALAILARNQPVARDLRFVVSALRMVIDLERIGDEATSMSERILAARGASSPARIPEIRALMDMAMNNYQEAVRAFMDGNGQLALKICRNEDEGAQAEVLALQKIMARVADADSGGDLFESMRDILICRSLNRIIRRSVNIAEHTWFVAKGDSLKHKKLPE